MTPEDPGSAPALTRWLQVQRVPYLLGPPWGPAHMWGQHVHTQQQILLEELDCCSCVAL